MYFLGDHEVILVCPRHSCNMISNLNDRVANKKLSLAETSVNTPMCLMNSE